MRRTKKVLAVLLAGVMMADGEVWFTDSFEGKGLVIITFNGLYK